MKYGIDRKKSEGEIGGDEERGLLFSAGAVCGGDIAGCVRWDVTLRWFYYRCSGGGEAS
jgi:hypothetical protein